MAHKIGLAAEVLTPQQAAERDPNIRMDIVGAVYFPQDAHLTPQKFMAVLTRRLERQGACFAWRRINRSLRGSGAGRSGGGPVFSTAAPATADAFRHEPAMIRVSRPNKQS